MQEKILAKLQELRAEEDLAAMEFAAGRSEETMKAYCNIDELPEELLGTGVALAGMLLDSGATGTPSQKAKNIKEGDISITFQEDDCGAKEEKLLACFNVELDRWRRMDW
ncbi:hypothetical protein [Anaerotignum sp.]